jgi:hypothetical protein
MKFLATTALATLLAACGAIPMNASSDPSSTVTCSQIDDQTYTSVQDHDIGQQCGTNSVGVYLCTPYSGSWSISFDSSDHTFFWAQGNDGDTGHYACSKAGLNLNGDGGEADNIQTLVRSTTLYVAYIGGTKADGLALESRSHQYELDQ